MNASATFADSLRLVQAGNSLSFDAMSAAIDYIMQGLAKQEDIASFLLALKSKGETFEEIAGAAAALRNHMTPIHSVRKNLVDTCGTGGDGSGTFNISTAAAIVTAAAGVPVAKHGNRSVSSRTGSADVLAELGVNIMAPVATIERCLDDLGLAFCFAQQLHPAMKHVSAVRKNLGVPTIFNLLGPLCNPAKPTFQVLGVGSPGGRSPVETHKLLALALATINKSHAIVVSGEDGLDEVSLGARTQVSQLRDGQASLLSWEPADFGLSRAGREMMQVDGPQQSAALIRRILVGEKGPPRDVVVLNAAAAIWTASITPAGETADLKACAAQAAEAIDSGAASKLLAQLAKLSSQ